jgi:hypothetical protein
MPAGALSLGRLSLTVQAVAEELDKMSPDNNDRAGEESSGVVKPTHLRE